jgi:hypothetical protein
MALATLHLAAIPVVAGLLAGSGAVATFIAAPSSSAVSAPASPAPQAHVPCAAQAWPYIDQKCLPAATNQRAVRLVNAPRTGEPIERTADAPVSSTTSAATARAAEPSLTTSDTVLRAPQQLATPDVAPQAAKPRIKRSETRQQRERRPATRSYQVPSESGRSGAMIVVRPLRLEAFR